MRRESRQALTLLSCCTFLLGLLLSGTSADAANLSLADRVAAEEGIARVYYRHQIDADRPFEEAVPREVLERRVRAYLERSAALERIWSSPITADMLEAEWQRIAWSTRLPDRLAEIYDALNHDPILIQECFVRPVLAARLARDRFDQDVRIHASRRAEAEAAYRQLRDLGIDPSRESPRRWQRIVVHSAGSGESMGIGVREERRRFVVRHPGDEPDPGVAFVLAKVSWDSWWEGARRELDVGIPPTVAREVPLPRPGQRPPSQDVRRGAGEARAQSTVREDIIACAEDDTWVLQEPFRRQDHTGVWTGSLFIVWGGRSYGNEGNPEQGGRYDPVTDTWTFTSTANAPRGRYAHTAVWTGSEMIVWGGAGFLGTGGRYDPAADEWRPTSTVNAPSGRQDHLAVWTGSRMLVWGGNQGGTSPYYTNTGGSYDPVSDTWTPLSTDAAPVGRIYATAAWTGTEMFVWGGAAEGLVDLGDGGLYDPATDTWRAVSSTDAPGPRYYPASVWTGSELIVWGGLNYQTFSYQRTGGRYDPATDAWASTSISGAPAARAGHQAVWTGDEMIVWGGGGIGVGPSGGRYDPATDSWTATPLAGAPPGRTGFTAAWTGDLLLVWGGYYGSVPMTALGRYDPDQDIWLTSARDLHPQGRQRHVAVWTGDEMIVWGGGANGSLVPPIGPTGGRYDPLVDGWSDTTTVGAPSGRLDAAAVWTGDEMIVWGGLDENGLLLGSGAAYDPMADQWAPLPEAGAPPALETPGLFWTGTEVLLWGGDPGQGHRYDPVAGAWTPMTGTNAPVVSHADGVWTGAEMVIWDGVSGGRYDPAGDSWASVSDLGAPGVAGPAVWSGSEMYVWEGPGGGRYDPVGDLWTPMNSLGSIPDAEQFAAVWLKGRFVRWGGTGVGGVTQRGARYDPVGEFWSRTSELFEPDIRVNHTAVVAGKLMLVWGGYNGGNTVWADLGAYSGESPPDLDTDGSSSCADCDDGNPTVFPGASPLCDGLNNDCLDPAWPGLDGTEESDDDGDTFSECAGDCDDTTALVFAGAPQLCDGLNNDCSDPYWPAVPAVETDDDVDGLAECEGDCDDNADSVFPTAPQLCDGINNDCADPTWPAPPGDEADDDGDGVRICAGDCDDSSPLTFPDAPQICDGVNNDCNDPSWPSLPVEESDADADGDPVCAGDCDDADPCRFSGQICDGFANDCADPALPAEEMDDDGDGFLECGTFVANGCGPVGLQGGGDCDDGLADTFPGADEVNDGLDNQCPGDTGFGAVDETSGNSGFFDPGDPSSYGWPEQAGASRYEAARSTTPDFSTDCAGISANGTIWSDPELPVIGGTFYYLNHPTKPRSGSWGLDSAGIERTGACLL